ncbi:MAG TPA: GspE/PulE family protein [Pirellulales bacterium]|jgi:type IV pilus assembly protein PilB|nr:GspE/PulE family protein [Pirellulales bacterium]
MTTAQAIQDALPTVVQLLFDKELLKPEQWDELAQVPRGEGNTIEGLLVERGLATERQIAEVYAEYLGVPVYELPEDVSTIDRSLAKQLPEKICREQFIVPIGAADKSIEVAIINPDGLMVVDEIEFLTDLNVRPLVTSRAAWETLCDAYFPESAAAKAKKDAAAAAAAQAKQAAKKSRPGSEADGDADDGDNDETILNLNQPLPAGPEARVIQIVNEILDTALKRRASDIHIEPFEERCRVRIRVDGVLHELTPPPLALYLPVISRFKILAKMDIAEKRVPQDGAIGLRTDDKRVDLRVSTVPAVWGEKIVMRILDKGAIPVQLTGLGFDERQSKDLMESLDSPHGLMLVTGPTGSGKSTTLYACLNYRNHPDENICTVEDPVEYKFDGMNQIQVKPQVGLTFSSVLRAFLRQDPDVIMVGEVRDQETAQICLRAALTGHFVLSTIHTNDSLASVSRLQDMGIEAFLLAATMRVLEAQRLIRRICKGCKQPYSCDTETARSYGFEVGQELFRGKGCDVCGGTGYKGRVGVFEVVRITSTISELIQKRTPLPELREAARGEGMKMLADAAIDKVRDGTTTLEEAVTIAMKGHD